MTDDAEKHTPPATPRPGAPARDKKPDPVQEASEESFPASDPPAWEPLHSGTPDEHADEHPGH